ncbi:hypothetical protein Bca4012_006412 [Brassica carinata]
MQTEVLPELRAPSIATRRIRSSGIKTKPAAGQATRSVVSTPKFDPWNSGEGATDQTPGSGVSGAKRKGAENPQVHNLEESDSEPESDKETPEKISATESSMTAYLEKMFSTRFDAMQSMVERLPRVAPPIRRSRGCSRLRFQKNPTRLQCAKALAPL